MTSRYAVVIVGLGPVGATLALLLGRAGIRTLVLEREREIHPLSRAVALDDVALRVLQSAGIALAAGPALIADPVLRFASAQRQTLLEVRPPRSVHGHPSVAFFHQPDVERQLRAELNQQPSVEVLLEHELADLRQHEHSVSVSIRHRYTGERRAVECSSLVGCDGARSDVRRLAGIRLRGYTSRHRWLVVDTTGSGRRGARPFEFICDPRRPTVSAPLPGGRYRYEFMLLAGEDAAEMQQPGNVRALLAPHMAAAELDELDIARANVYAFHARVADRWRRHRVFLAGDAAHLSPPFAGLGLSSGLRDVDNLAWKLTAATTLGESGKLLETYESERRRDAIELIGRAVLLGTLIQTRRRPLANARNLALRTASRVPTVQRWATRGGWKPLTTYRRGFVAPAAAARGARGAPGRQIPQPAVRLTDMSERRLDDVLGRRFALVACRIYPTDCVDATSREILDRFGVRLVHVGAHSPVVGSGPIPARARMMSDGDGASNSDATSDVLTVEDRTGTLENWFARAGATLALLRPDRYAYALFNPPETRKVIRDFATALGVVFTSGV